MKIEKRPPSMPVNWRAPIEIYDWLRAQPGGISETLLKLCRAAMEGRGPDRVIELEGRVAELRELLRTQAPTAMQETPQPVAPIAHNGNQVDSLW